MRYGQMRNTCPPSHLDSHHIRHLYLNIKMETVFQIRCVATNVSDLDSISLINYKRNATYARCGEGYEDSSCSQPENV